MPVAPAPIFAVTKSLPLGELDEKGFGVCFLEGPATLLSRALPDCVLESDDLSLIHI